MSEVIDEILNWLRPWSTIILVVFVVIVFSIASFYGYKKYGSAIMKKDETKNVANANRRNKTADLYIFHVKWCPHCRTALPIWQSFYDDYNKREVNGVSVKCHTVDCTDDSDPKIAEYITKYSIESYPTVKLVLGDGTIIEFDAKIERESLSNFLDTVLTDK